MSSNLVLIEWAH